MRGERRQPVARREHLEIPFQHRVHLGPVDDGAGLRVVFELLLAEGGAQGILRDCPAAVGVVGADVSIVVETESQVKGAAESRTQPPNECHLRQAVSQPDGALLSGPPPLLGIGPLGLNPEADPIFQSHRLHIGLAGLLATLAF
jgi:hypothetical protein